MLQYIHRYRNVFSLSFVRGGCPLIGLPVVRYNPAINVKLTWPCCDCSLWYKSFRNMYQRKKFYHWYDRSGLMSMSFVALSKVETVKMITSARPSPNSYGSQRLFISTPLSIHLRFRYLDYCVYIYILIVEGYYASTSKRCIILVLVVAFAAPFPHTLTKW